MPKVIQLVLAVLCLPTLALSSTAQAELRPDKVHVADQKKNLSYIRDGLITGGDKAINEVAVRDIRRAVNPGYERIVIDLEGTKNGEPAAIPRPPFYQVAVTPDERRIVVTLWGKPRLNFDSRRVVNAFKKSSVIQSVQLLPRVEENTWSFVFELKGESPVEVFELSDPVRVIMDVKRDVKGSQVASTTHPAPAAKKAKPKGKAKLPKKRHVPHVESHDLPMDAPPAAGTPEAHDAHDAHDAPKAHDTHGSPGSTNEEHH